MIKFLRSNLSVLTLATCGLVLISCASSTIEQQEEIASTSKVALEEPVDTQVDMSQSEPEQVRTEGMKLNIEGTELAVAWEENSAVAELEALVADTPLSVKLSMYGGFEQVGPLGVNLPTNDTQITTEPGDIVLYAGKQISIFYDSHSWSYTRLGRITDKSPDELAELLGKGDVNIIITLAK